MAVTMDFEDSPARTSCASVRRSQRVRCELRLTPRPCRPRDRSRPHGIQKKKVALLPFFLNLVEAAGIEPASANPLPSALHA